MKTLAIILLATTPSGLVAQTIINTDQGSISVPTTTQDSASGTTTFIYLPNGSVVTTTTPKTVERPNQ